MKRKIKKAFNHILKGLEIPNIIISIRKSRFEKLQRAHDSIHEFMDLAPLCIPSKRKVSWQPKSAFLTYHWEAFHLAHRSFFEALCGYYTAGFILLRSTLELIIKGAFFECLAHRKFREKSKILDKDERGTQLKKMISSVIGNKNNLEETSAAIYDMVMVRVNGKVFIEQPKYRPSIKTMIQQLDNWKILKPILDPVDNIYEIYSDLCGDVHIIPNKTDIGRRLSKEKELFETVIIPEELNRFSISLRKVMDMGIVIELSILSDWIKQGKGVKEKLKERLPVIEKDIQLNYSSLKIRNLLKRVRSQEGAK